MVDVRRTWLKRHCQPFRVFVGYRDQAKLGIHGKYYVFCRGSPVFLGGRVSRNVPPSFCSIAAAMSEMKWVSRSDQFPIVKGR